ncbi:MAG: NAD-dependent epimerase/dehydratase family protein [Hyphomicrobiaceae bacterium]|nr:NAD-dependent epimerase/dehydratase family protein [Hyphomicrobiaceae bacterium]
MKVVITGGAGFLGQKLIAALQERGVLAAPDDTSVSISEIICVDRTMPDNACEGVTYVEADIGSEGVFDEVVPGDASSIFHLAAVVSAEAEADFDLGMRVNLDATRALLERCRGLAALPRFVFASSVAAFGVAPPIVDDDTPVRPLNSYGVEKVIGEYLVGEYARRGFVDGRTVRLPTIVIRPGAPNKAASSFASSILREPLQGMNAVCPVSEDLAVWIKSPRSVVADLVLAHDLEAENWPDGLRVLNLPGLTVTVAEMIAALERAGGDTSLISWEPDPAIEAIVGSWPQGMTTDRANALGFTADESIDAVVRQFLDDELG